MSIAIPVNPSSASNFLAGNRAVFTINQVKGFEYFCQDFVLPGLNMNSAIFPTRFSNVKFSGDKIQYEPLNITFVVDEHLLNWIAMFDWFTGVGFPENHEQYADKPIETSDATIIIYSNHQNPIAVASFKNLVPVSLGTIDFSTQDQETLVRRSNVSFEYDYFKIAPYK